MNGKAGGNPAASAGPENVPDTCHYLPDVAVDQDAWVGNASDAGHAAAQTGREEAGERYELFH